MSTLSERLKIALSGPPRKTQAALAKACGIKPPSVSDWMTGKTQSIEGKNLVRAAAFLGVNPKWLATGVGQKDLGESNVIALHDGDAIPDDMVQISEYKVQFSAGNGCIMDYCLVEESEPATYRLSWFKKRGINPEKAKRFKVHGDSMEPFLFANDSVLVNMAENDLNRIIDGKVYAIRYVDELRVKRLYRQLDGTLILRSDNPSYVDEVVPPELAEENISIIGRVRDKSGSGGL